MHKRVFVLLLFMPVSLMLQCKTVYSQDVNQYSSEKPEALEKLSIGEVKSIVNKAISEADADKEKKRLQIIDDLKSKLNIEAQKWIALVKQRNEDQLNKLGHRDWELGGKVTYPVPYDYYLRGYDYFINKIDLQTDSLSVEYKGDIIISEKLRVEGYHSSDAAEIEQYYYTLTRSIVLRLEYTQDKFMITDTKYGPFQLESGW